MEEKDTLEQSLITTDHDHQEGDHAANEKTSGRGRESYINGSNPISSLFFAWLYPFLSLGAKQTISVSNMPKLPEQFHSHLEFQRMKTTFEGVSKSTRQGFTLIKVMFKTYQCEFMAVLGFLVVNITVVSIGPYLTALIMRYISHREDYPSGYGGILFALIMVLQVVKSLSEAHLGYRFTRLGINLTNGLTLLIFGKSLRYPSIAEKDFRESQIINYSQVDAERMSRGGYQLACLFLTPIQIIIGLAMMYYFIGLSFLSGIGILLVTSLCTYITSKRSYFFNRKILQKKDDRMRTTQQMLDIIRYIKINSIQKYFFNKVDGKRREEIKYYKKQGFMDVLNIFIYWLASPLILSGTFITYILLGNQINSEVAFTTIMIFTSLQYPIRLLPNSISAIIQIFTSIKRIQRFLDAKEIEAKHIRYCQDGQEEEFAVKIQRGNFYYAVEKEEEKNDDGNSKGKKTKQKKHTVQETEESPNVKKQPKVSEQKIQSDQPDVSSEKYVRVLKDLNATIKKGSFTLILGDIGSGKTSLLMAILNQMIADMDSFVTVAGTIAYSAQKPWIMSASVKDNIVFESEFVEERFNQVIHFASLEHDLKILPFGVDTQIGEKGINISGGQKARISLARALYSNRDIYFLDDVLSAVDVHVGDFLMLNTLKGYLKGKTILMPTHAVKYAELADQIIVMKKGRMVKKGHYQDIKHTQQFQQVFLHEKSAKPLEEEQPEESQPSAVEGHQTKQEKAELSLSLPFNQHAATIGDKVVRQLMLPEDQEAGEVDMKIFKEYIQLNGGYWNFMFLICLAMALWISFTTGAAIIMEQWCEDPANLGYYLYLYVGLSVGSNVFILFRAYKLIMAGARQGEIVHRKMMKSLLYASLGDFFNRVPVGRIVNRLTKDLRELDEEIGVKVGNVLVTTFRLAGNLVICVYGSSPWIIIPIFIVGFLAHRVRRYYMKSQIQVARFQKSTNSPIISTFISTIGGLSTIRAYRMSRQFTCRQLSFLDINKRVRLTKAGMESWFSVNLTYLSFIINMASVGYCIFTDNTDAALAGLLMNYAVNLSSDIISVTNNVAIFQAKVISLERIYSVTKIEPEQGYAQYCGHWTKEEEGFQEVIRKGEIQMRGVSARYRVDLPDVLKEMTLKIRAGEKIGIVGRTGAGKTTIINTLLRITDISSGDLLIDGTPISSYSLKNLRYCITMIDQQPTLLKSTFRQNLDITAKYTDSELYQTLKECNLYETIVQKGGLDAAVSNESLSAGEKQLLCICRAFLKHSRIVLVDEATANIDVKNDQNIQKAIHGKFKDCTVLTIAHRLSTLQHSDRVLVMEKGQVVEFGSPRELETKEKGWYREMVLKNSKQFLI